MLERIERVERIKRLDNDVGNAFARKRGYGDSSKNGKSFAQVLQDTLQGGGSKPTERELPAAYALEISTVPKVTQSLFYDNSSFIGTLVSRYNARSAY